MRPVRLPVFSWWRPTRAGWVLLAHGLLDALLARSSDGDLIVPAGELPPGATPETRTRMF